MRIVAAFIVLANVVLALMIVNMGLHTIHKIEQQPPVYETVR